MVATRSGVDTAMSPDGPSTSGPGPVASMSRTDSRLESLLVRDPFARRPPRAIACVVRGTVGECAGHRADKLPLWRSGMLLVVAEYVAFVALSLWGGTPAPKNKSICGYLELLPDWIFFLYAHVAAAGVDCTLFQALAVFRRERNEGHRVFGVLRALTLATCALCLAGFSAIPRCLWTAHQNAVLTWVLATSVAMFASFARDRSLERYSPFPLLAWAVGVFFCVAFYYESSMRFYAAEATTVVAYILWCSNANHAFFRASFSVARVAALDGAVALVLTGAFRYNQNRVCEVTGMWR